MKKVVKTLFAIVISITFVNAQNTVNKKLDEVVVSSNRASSTENTSNVQIISLEEIQNAPVQTIEDLLEYAINVDVRQRGGQGVQADISMRGGTFEQVLVMLNGIKLNDPQTGHHTMDLPVSLEQIERIEVITGGATRIFGNYAYTGAINIITKKEGNSSVTLSSGQNGFKSAEINYALKTSNINHNISINQKRSDGFPVYHKDRDTTTMEVDYIIKNYYYQASGNIAGVKALLNIGYTDKEFGAYTFYTPKYPTQFEKTKTTFSSLQFKKEGSISLENKLYWKKHNDEFILFRNHPSLYHNFHETNVYGMDFNAVQKTKNGSNLIGMEIRTDKIISNRLGEELENPIEIDSLNTYTKGQSRTTTNLFAEKNLTIENLSVSLGVMMNIDSEYGNEYFPGIDISYNINDDIKLFTSYNKSMRTPNYTELYYASPTNQGNEYLKSEHSTNKEIGVKWTANYHKTTFTLYQREGSNMIDWILAEGDSIWRTQNLNQLTTKGYEINSKININKLFNSNLPIKNLGVNYASNKLNKKSDGFQSAYVLDNLKTNFSISANQLVNDKLRIDWRATYQDREGGYTDFNTGLEVEYLPFWIASTRVSYNAFKNSTLFLEINNLFDKEYVDFGNIPQQGRWMRVGAKINL